MIGKETTSTEIVTKVAAREGIDPLELTSPLNNAVDSDALNALMDHHNRFARGNVHVEFQYHGYQVTINEPGGVSLEETRDVTLSDDD